MSDQISHFHLATLHTKAMLRLPVGPEYSGVAGLHQIHDLPPLGVAAAAGWVWVATRSLTRWVIGALRRRATNRLATPAGLPIAMLPDSSTRRLQSPKWLRAASCCVDSGTDRPDG